MVPATTNYLIGTNPYGLTKPPAWFLREMTKFDADLVLFPSMRDSVFRLARRCRKSPGVPPANVPGVQNHPDTVFMWNHKLVPVTTIVPRDHWGTHIFQTLANRDTWRHGGSQKVISLIEDQELRRAEHLKKQFNDEGDERHHDAYQALKYRTGQRVSMAHTGAAVNKRVKPQHFTGPRVVLAAA